MVMWERTRTEGENRQKRQPHLGSIAPGRRENIDREDSVLPWSRTPHLVLCYVHYEICERIACPVEWMDRGKEKEL